MGLLAGVVGVVIMVILLAYGWWSMPIWHQVVSDPMYVGHHEILPFVQATISLLTLCIATFGGALYGAGQAAEEEKNLDEILASGVIGAGTGAVFGAGVGAGIPIAKAGLKKVISPFLEKTPNKIARLEGKVADEYSKALNLNATQRKLEQRSERDVALFLAKEGVEVQVEKGQLVADDALEALERKARAENQAFERLLKDDGGYINLEGIRKYARSLIDDVGTARTIAENKIDDEINAFADQYGRQGIKGENGEILIPKYLSNKLKQKMWQAGKFNRLAPVEEQTKAGAARMIGNAFKTAIEKTTKDANIQKFNQRLGDLAEAQFMLNSRNGMTVKGGRLGKYFGRTIGAIVGAKGGPLGSLVGATAGDKIADFAQNPAITTGMWQRALRRLRKEGQEGLVDQIEGILEKRAIERAGRKLLGPERTIFLGAETLPQPKVTISEAAKTFGRDPKTGQFKLFYKSMPKK